MLRLLKGTKRQGVLRADSITFVVKCYLHKGDRFNAQFGISSHISLKQGYLFYVMSIFGCYAQCRGTEKWASKIGTFTCRTSPAKPKQAKEPIMRSK